MPEKTYRVGVIGLSGIAAGKKEPDFKLVLDTPVPASHVQSYALLPKTEVVAVCELKPELFDKFKHDWGDEFPDANTYTDYRELIDKENLDILSVCTSDHRHTDIVVYAANAGVKGIVCEKPFASSVDDCDRMIEACEANKTLVTVDHTRRWQLPFERAREAIEDGDIGKVMQITGNMGGARAMTFRNGTHLIDGVKFFADSDPEWVFAELEEGFDDYSSYGGDGGRDPATDPACSGYVHFKNGVRAYINIVKEMKPGFYIQVMGESGELDIYHGVVLRKDMNSAENLILPTHRIYGIAACIDELIGVMENGGELISPPREAKKTVEIIIGFLQSHARGNVRVDLPLPPGH